MKKILTSFLALTVAFSAIFSVPSVFSNVFAETGVIKNTYDESGYAYTDIKFDKSPNPIATIVDGGVTGKALKFNRIYNTSYCATLPYVNIYNDSSATFDSFKPKKDTSYKLSFKYKQTSKFNYASNTLKLFGVKNADLSDGTDLGDLCVIEKKTTVPDWTEAELSFTVNDDFNSLGILLSSTITGSSAGACNIYIDDIALIEIDTTITVHHPDNSEEQITVSNKTNFNDLEIAKRISGKRVEGLYTDSTFTKLAEGAVIGKSDVWAKWIDVPSYIENTYEETELGTYKKGGTHKLKCNGIFYLSERPGAAPNTTRVLQFNPICGQTSVNDGKYTYVEIYDPNSANFDSFIAEPDADYKITFDYKLKSAAYETNFNIREVRNGKIGDVIATAATIKAKDPDFASAPWAKAEAMVAITQPNTALAITIEYGKAGDETNLYPYIDNIAVEKIENRETVDLTLNNYKADGSSKVVTVSKNTVFSKIKADAVEDNQFLGWYTDKFCKTPVDTRVGDCTAVWAKWLSADSGNIENTFDEPGYTYTDIKFDNSPNPIAQIDSNGFTGKALKFNRIYNTTYCATLPYVNIYDKSFAAFKPEKDTTYRLTLKYKSTKSFTYASNTLKLFGVKNADLSDGTDLGDLCVIPKQIAVNDWKTAEILFTTKDDFNSLGIVLSSTVGGTSAQACNIYIDNITLETIPDGNTTIKIHNYDSSPYKVLDLPNATLFSDIEIPFVYGKKYEGMYFDEDCQYPVEGVVYGNTEVWVKWRTRTNSDADEIVNSYDDNGVYYKEELNLDRFDKNFNLTETEEKKANNYITRYKDKNFENPIDSGLIYQNFAIGSIVKGRRGNAIQLNSASISSVGKPPLVKIYDNRDSEKKIYKPRPNTIYKIEFYVKSTQILTKDVYVAVKAYNDINNTFGTGDFLKYCYTIKKDTVVKDWVKVETYFTVPDVEYDFLGISLMASGTAAINGKNEDTDTYKVQVSIDDVSLTEMFETYNITVNPNNGDKPFNIPFVSGQTLDTVPEVKRDGYVFAGWFTDAALQTPFTYGKMPSQNIDIYGKWEELDDSAYNFSSGFETEDFTVSYPYTNTANNSQYTNNMSAQVTVVTNPDDVHDEGKRYLHIENDPQSSKQTMDMAAIALLNPDGSCYQVTKGTRYSISFSLRCDTDCYVVPVISNQTPTGKLNLFNSTEINRTWFRPYWYHYKESWGTMQNVFIPNASGRVYLLVYHASTYVDIDNLKIESKTSNEIVQVKFYNEAGTSVSKTVTGRAGDWMFPSVPKAKEGFVFSGWYDEDGVQYSKSVLPERDMKLYPKYCESAPVSDTPPTVKEEVLKIDFEGDNGGKLAFYQSNNDAWINNNDAAFVVNDPNGAHSGSNYFKFINAGQWAASAYRRFRLYNENTSDHRVYLEPLSVYKIGFWMKVDRTWSATMRIASFDTTDSMNALSNQIVATLTEVETEDNYGKWIYYEGELTTGSEVSTVGLMMSGGFLTASVDDVTVYKMRKLTVSFDSCGGTPVNSIETFENQCVVAPLEPEREGYYFAGWYADLNSENSFDFNNTPITKNITLYAKWIKAGYKDVTTYDIEEILNILPTPNPELDEQLKVSADKNSDNADSADNLDDPDNNILPLVLTLVGVSVLLIVGGVFTFIIIGKRKIKR